MAVVGSSRTEALPCTIDIIIAVYKNTEYLVKLLNSLPDDNDINVTAVSDMSPYESEHRELAENSGFTFYALNYEDNKFRMVTAHNYALERTQGDIVFIMDDNVQIIDGHNFFSNLKRVLTTYRNLIVFPQRTDRVFSTGEVKLRAQEDKCVTSTADLITPQWEGVSCFGTFAIRRDFLNSIGGYVKVDGYSNIHEDMCRRVVRQGGLITLFEDMKYYNHLPTGAKFFREKLVPDINWDEYKNTLNPIVDDPNSITIDIIIPIYSKVEFLANLYNSIPEDDLITITAIDDTSPNSESLKSFCDDNNINYYRQNFEVDLYRKAEAVLFGYRNTSSDIVIIIDEDMIIREPDDFFNKVKKLHTSYSNLLMFTIKHNVLYPSLEDLNQPWVEASNILSTYDDINIQYSGTQCDGCLIVRRDLVELGDGLIGGDGYGEYMYDNIKNLVKVGGCVGLFSDLNISHCITDPEREHEEPFVNWDSYKTKNELEVI